MVRTNGGHSCRSRVRRSSPPPAAGQSNPHAAAPTTSSSTAPVPTALAPRRYDTRVGPTLPFPTHPQSSRSARTFGPGESSSSRPQEPPSPLNQGPAKDLTLDLSPTLIIRRPIFHCGPIIENSDCNTRDLHSEVYYNLPAFAEDPKLIDSILLVQGAP